MNIGVLVTARLGSSRLPRKHLLEVNGQSFMACLLARLRPVLEVLPCSMRLVIATSDESENRDFARFECADTQVFYGHRDNIPRRHLEAARALGLDALVSVDGDDILCSPQAVVNVARALLDGADLVRTSGLPLGMNAMGYRTQFLEQVVTPWWSRSFDTGWGVIFPDDAWLDIQMPLAAIPELRFTLDYPEDQLFFTSVIHELMTKEILSTATDEDIVAIVESQKMFQLNQSVNQEYWQNFHAERARLRGEE